MDRGDEAKLIRKVLNGDREAFGSLVERYKDMVYGVAYAYLRNFHDAQDLSQEVFIKAFINLESYDPSRPFGNWLYTIAKRMAIDQLRSKRFEMEEVTEQIPDPSPDPEDEIERKEREQMLREALDKLSDRLREAFCLYHVDRYSIREISRTLSVPEGTIKRWLHESRKILKDEVIKMIKERFERETLTWRFTQDVVRKVSDLKSVLLDLIPQELKALVSMSDEELKERKSDLLRSLVKALHLNLSDLKPGEEISISVSELTEEQREYLWKVLHELELIELMSILRGGTIYTTLISDFHSVRVKVGLYDAPRWREIHNRPYIRLARPNPDGSEHSIQLKI